MRGLGIGLGVREIASGVVGNQPYFLYGQPVATLEGGTTTLDEVSGVAASYDNSDVLWCIDDSAGAVLFAVNTDGSRNGNWTVTGASNTDWEDVAVANGYVYVADIGDNAAARGTIVIYRIVEPTTTGSNGTIDAGDIEAITCQYPGTPLGEGGGTARDAETLLVDPLTNDMYIVTKRTSVPQVFRLAYQASYSGTQTLEHVGNLSALPEPSSPPTPGQAVGGCISANGKEALLKTYDKVFRYSRTASQSVIEMLQGTRVETACVGLGSFPYQEPQSEAITFDATDSGYYTISETGTGADAIIFPIFYYARVDRAPTTVEFQQGTDSYTGCSDTYTDTDAPGTAQGSATTMIADFDAGGRYRQGLCKFESIVGASDIPSGSKILGAHLEIYINTEGQSFEIHKMLADWVDTDTLNDITGGTAIARDDAEASAAVVGNTTWAGNIDTYVGPFQLPLNAAGVAAIQAWVNGETNNGFLFHSNDEDGLQIRSADYATVGDRPKLVVQY